MKRFSSGVSRSGGPEVVTADDILELIDDPSRIALAAQPIVDLKRGTVVGYELLARFSLPEGKVASPERVFISAVGSELGAELEAAALARSLELASFKPENTFVSINIDPMHIEHPRVRAALSQYPDLSGLFFELTEHHPSSDSQTIRRALDVLRRHGAMIAIDDAGAGYAGMKRLLELRPQLLKLDRSLLTDVHDDEATRALVQTLGDLAARLDAWILAEGVETEAELRALVQLGVPLAQGHFLGAPEKPWTPIRAAAQNVMRSRVRSRDSAVTTSASSLHRELLVGDLVEIAMTCSGSEDWPPHARVALRLDHDGRPIEMRLSSEDGPRIRMAHDLLRVKVESGVAEVAFRAATRDERLQWDPLVCIDDRGALEGIVTMQRIVTSLATMRSPASVRLSS